MNENDIYPEDPTLDIDDVEGHGLKEVAAGLGAAAVLAGGAAGATHLASSSVSVHPSGSGAGISVSVDDPVGTADRTMDGSISAVQQSRDGALDQADSKIDKVQTVADRAPSNVAGIVSHVQSTVHGTKAWAGDVKTAATDLAKAEVHGATSTATGTATATTTTAGNTVSHTGATVDSKVDHTTTTAGTTVRAVDRKVATILSVVTTTAVDGVHTAKVVLQAADAGAGVDSSSGGGWVLVKAGDTVLAQVHMSGGTATASWTMPLAGGHSVTISYTGDNVFAPSLRTITL